MDLRIEQIFQEEMRGDTSFQGKESFFSSLFGTEKFTKKEMRKTWDEGIKHGIEIGLNRSSLNGHVIELNNNAITQEQRFFLEEFYKLAEKHNCAVQYHPQHGMTVIELHKNNF